MLRKGGEVRTDAFERVLVAEDDRDLRQTLEVWLDDIDGVRVTTVGNGGAAVAAVEESDLFICDRRLPGLNGGEIIETEAAKGTPVVVVSACRPDEDLSRDDVDRYLTKPVSREELAEAVDEVVAETYGAEEVEPTNE